MAKRGAARRLVQILLLLCLVVALSGPALAEAGFSGRLAGDGFPAVTLTVKGVDVRDVLQMLARLGPLNIVADQTVKGEVSFTFSEVPYAQALDLVLRAAGLEGRLVNPRTMLVTAASAEPVGAPQKVEVFTLNHADPAELLPALSVVVARENLAVETRSRSLLVRGTPEQLAQVRTLVARLDVPGPAPAETATATPAPALPPAPPAEEPKQVEVVALRFAKAEAVKNALGFILPSDAMLAEARTNSLVLKGTAGELAKARQLIAELDAGKPQILIEARLEEISQNALTDLGIEFPASWQVQSSDLANLATSGVMVSAFTATLKALEDKGAARLLANPRIAVADGQEAKINIGDRIPLVLEETQNGITSQRIEYINVGIELTVSPQLNGADSLTATIKPSVSTVVGQTPAGYPQIRTREASTILQMKNNQTIAIGGLKQLSEVKDRNGVAGLQRLPIIGALFAKHKTDAQESELVIFITARIIPEGEGPTSPELFPVTPQTAPAKPAPGTPAEAGPEPSSPR